MRSFVRSDAFREIARSFPFYSTKMQGTLEMDVPAQTDFWRIAHYGFTVDDGPFLYATYGGEFEAKIKVSGEYKVRFDQAGIYDSEGS